MSTIALSAAERPRSALLAEVVHGLSLPQKELAPKWFYDRRGSTLFEEITRLPEYYLTRAERALLERSAASLIGMLRTRALIELGAGSAEKSRILLDAMRTTGEECTYIPVDVSASFLNETVQRLREEYPEFTIGGVVSDIGDELGLPCVVSRPLMVAFLGSTIGNFAPPAAVRLLRRIRATLRFGDALLLGVDLRKDPAIIEAAYNDARGVTAAFNANALRVLNAELGADFQPPAFAHRAFYDRALHRIEMHLVARVPQRVTIPDAGVFHFRGGESIRTEISCKHDRDSIESLLRRSALHLEHWLEDSSHGFALAVAAVA